MTSSTFDKLLAQQRGALPQSTSAYYELEQGDLKYDGVKNINDAIDADVKDFQERTNWAIEESKRYHESKEKQIQKFVGLIPSVAGLKKWDDARKVAAAEYDRKHRVLEDLPINVDPENVPDKKKDDFIEDNNAKLNTLTNVNSTQLNFIKNSNELSKTEKIVGLAESETQRLNISGIEAGNAYVEEFPTYVSGEVHVKKRLKDPTTGLEMPYAMSYMEVLQSDNREIKQYLGLLWRDIYLDYYAAMKQKGYIDKMGDQYYRYKVFPRVSKSGDIIRNKLLTRQLDQSIKGAEDRINENILDQYNSNPRLEDRINFLFGKNGFLAQREIGLDGKKDNPRAWRELSDWMYWAVTNNKMGRDGEDALRILHSDKIPQRGGKLTTLKKLNNPNANALIDRIELAVTDLKNKVRRSDKIIEDDWIEDNVTDKISSLESNQKDDTPLTTTQINNARNEVIEAAKGEGYYLLPTDTRLSRFNTLETNLTRNESQARSELDPQVDNREPLSGELIKHIPVSGDPNRNRKDYLQAAEDFGTWGLTQDEKRIRGLNVEYELTKGPAAILDPKHKGSEYGTGILQKGLDLYDAEYHGFMTAARGEKNYKGEEFRQLKHNAKEHALREVKKLALEKKQGGKDYKGYFSDTDDGGPKVTTGQFASTGQVIQKINAEGENALKYNKYYNTEEEEAVEKYLEWKQNPKGRPPVNYWSSFSPYIWKVVPGLPNSQSIAETRLAATEYLREEGYVENVPPPTSESNNDVDIAQGLQKGDESKYCQAVVKPETLDIMLKDLALEDRDIDTVYSPGKATWTGYQKEKFDNELPQGQPLSQTTVEEVALAAGRDPDLRFGIYDIPANIVWDMYDKGIISSDEVFDEELQKEIVIRKIINTANERGSNKTWDNTYRRNNWLTNKEKAEFKRIMATITGEENIDPYNDIQLLAPECAKALIGSAMGQQ